MTQFRNIETNELEYKPLKDLILFQTSYLNDNFINKYTFITIEQEKYITTCEDCGEIINLNDDTYYTTKDNTLICESCYDNYHTCADCGSIIYCDDSIYIEDEDVTVCEDCAANNYYRCDRCGEYFSRSGVYRDDYDTVICDHCYDRFNYYRCDNCGAIIQESDTFFTDNDGVFCESCYEEEKTNSLIYKYGYHPDLVFHRLENEENELLFYGFELEVDVDTDTAEKFLSYFEEDEIYLSYDSTVDGYEIVSHPMTWGYLNSTFKNRLEQGLNYLKSVGAKGHNYGGMHIHISRQGINNIQFNRLHQLLYRNYNTYSYNVIKTISQRQSSNIHWCDWNIQKNTNKKTTVQAFKYKLDTKDYNSNKYTAINLQHNNTIEFRIFNSNLRIERVFKNLEFIKSLLDYTKDSKKTQFKYYFNWLKQINNLNTYHNLSSFLIEKGLIKLIKNNIILHSETKEKGVLLCA